MVHSASCSCLFCYKLSNFNCSSFIFKTESKPIRFPCTALVCSPLPGMCMSSSFRMALITATSPVNFLTVTLLCYIGSTLPFVFVPFRCGLRLRSSRREYMAFGKGSWVTTFFMTGKKDYSFMYIWWMSSQRCHAPLSHVDVMVFT